MTTFLYAVAGIIVGGIVLVVAGFLLIKFFLKRFLGKVIKKLESLSQGVPSSRITLREEKETEWENEQTVTAVTEHFETLGYSIVGDYVIEEMFNVQLRGLVNPACNYYFMAASTFLIAAAGTWVTEKIVVPRLGEYRGEEKTEGLRALNPGEKRGLWFALAIVAFLAIIFLLALIPENGFLREPETGSFLRSPFMEGIVAIIFIAASLAGIAYGVGAGTFRSDSDIMKAMEMTMKTLGLYLVLVFFASQFVAFFKWSNLGLIMAIKGAEVLEASGLGPIPLMLAFILLSAVINLTMGSASAKWAIMAPVFIPMFMLLGYTPELVQAAYRVGDSSTNIISPMMSYFALVVAFMEKYDPRAGIGTVVATMLPYTVVFLIVWMILLSLWLIFGLPVGPGADLFL